MVCLGLDGLARLPLIAPVVLLIIKASLSVFSGTAERVIVLLAARATWLVMLEGKLPPSSITRPLVMASSGLAFGL